MQMIVCETIEQVEKQLEFLGDDAALMALRLLSLSCLGRMGAGCSCPIAIFLQIYCGLIEPQVTPDKIQFRFAHDPDKFVYMPVYEGLCAFIHRFDSREFPSLIR